MAEIDIIREALRYEPDTGRLFWKERPLDHFKTWKAYRHWNSKYPGAEALTCINATGYRSGTIAGVGGVLAHRVIWVLVHGEWPPNAIDHISHDRLDNRLANLRAVTWLENSRNLMGRSEHMGVVWNKRLRKWVATGSINNRRLHLGTFATLTDAVARRKDFERDHGFHANHGRIAA